MILLSNMLLAKEYSPAELNAALSNFDYRDLLVRRIDKDALFNYRGAGQSINYYLRTGKIHDIQDSKRKHNRYIKSIDRIINKSPMLPSNINMFRGVDMSWRGKLYSIGEVFSDKAFISTSLNYKTASWFAGSGGKSVIYITYSNRKIKGLWLDTENEEEVLLPRNTVFKVMKEKASNLNERVMIQIVQICEKVCTNNFISRDTLRVFEKH